jgi:hypothetical protein
MHRTHPDPFLSLEVFQLLKSEPNQTAGGDGKAQTELRPEIAESGSGAGEQSQGQAPEKAGQPAYNTGE